MILINREQRRNYTKQLKAKGFNDKQIDFIIKSKQLQEKQKLIPEGTKVKLNINQIKSDVNYQRKTDIYHKWTEDHKDNVFTVEYDEKHKYNPILVCFKEDTQYRWLHWIGDLTIIKEVDT